MGRWVYGGGGDQGGTYWQPDYEGEQPEELGLTKDQVTNVFQNVLGRDPSEYDLGKWTGWGDVDGSFDEEKAMWDVAQDITLLPEYRQKTQPFYDPNKKGNEYFDAGINYYTQQGYTPSGDYLGSPTAFYDKDGNLVSWYGNIGRTFGKSGKYTPNRTEEYGWHMADELKNIPNAIPSAARSTSDTHGWLGGGQWIAPVAMMAALAGAAALAPLAAGAGAGASGAGAGALGAAEGLTALEAATLMGGTLSDAGAAAMLGGTLSDVGLAAQALGYTTASDAIAAGLMTPEGVTTALGVERLADLGAPLASEGTSLGDIFKNVNRARNVVSKLTGSGSNQPGGGSGGAGGSSPLSILPSGAAAQPYPVSPPLNPYMTSLESPSEVAARGLKVPGAEDPQLKQVTPQLRKLLIDKLGTNQNQFIGDPLGALDRGEMSPGFRSGGEVLNEEGEPHIPEFITGKTGHYVDGRGTGQSDEIPAMLADGEYVIDADTVAALGDGSSKAGSELLDKFREALREHKRSAPADKIPPKASPLQYMKMAMKAAGR